MTDTKTIIPKDPFEESELLTRWALDKAWKIAVSISGITDWSKTKMSNPEREFQVETMQMNIAPMLLSNVHAIIDRKQKEVKQK